VVTLLMFLSFHGRRNAATLVQSMDTYREGEEWIAPDPSTIPADSNGDLIRYGMELMANTARYLGPTGIVARASNGMNCQNCHLDAGRLNYANPFSAAKNNYPRYRARSGRLESIEFRVNECMKRSLNGEPLDSLSLEMRAMVAYINWVGSRVPQGVIPVGTGVERIALLNRPADPLKGKQIFSQNCARCHGENGEGIKLAGKENYEYPPLWGPHSYNVSAGLYRLTPLAGFIKNNMPFGSNWKSPQLTSEMAWDVAAYICSQPRPMKFFAGDWKDISKKPVDFPFAPYADNFPEQRHKYGPFGGMK
jgi:thiosulfate dehydrogenase